MNTIRTLPATHNFDPKSFFSTASDTMISAQSPGQRLYDVMNSARRRLTSSFVPVVSVALTSCSRKFTADLESFNSAANTSGAESFTDSPLLFGAIVLAIVAVPVGLGIRHYLSGSKSVTSSTSQNQTLGTTVQSGRTATAVQDKPATYRSTKPAPQSRRLIRKPQDRSGSMQDFYGVAATVTGYVPHDQINVWEAVSDRMVGYVNEMAGGVTMENIMYLYEDCYKALDQMSLTEAQIERRYADIAERYSPHQVHKMHIIRLQTLFYTLAKLAQSEECDDFAHCHLRELPKLIKASEQSQHTFNLSIDKMRSALTTLTRRRHMLH